MNGRPDGGGVKALGAWHPGVDAGALERRRLLGRVPRVVHRRRAVLRLTEVITAHEDDVGRSVAGRDGRRDSLDVGLIHAAALDQHLHGVWSQGRVGPQDVEARVPG